MASHIAFFVAITKIVKKTNSIQKFILEKEILCKIHAYKLYWTTNASIQSTVIETRFDKQDYHQNFNQIKAMNEIKLRLNEWLWIENGRIKKEIIAHCRPAGIFSLVIFSSGYNNFVYLFIL